MSRPAKPITGFKVVNWWPVVAAFLTLGLGLTLSEVKVKIGWLPLIAAIVICTFIFYLAMHCFARDLYPTSAALLEDLEKHISTFTARDYVPWIRTSSQLATFEAAVTLDEIWLVTSDLSEDIPGKIFFDVVHRNLKRGVHYRYFIPRSLQAEARSQQLAENHKGAGKLDVVHLSDDFFFLSECLDLVIYDPLNTFGGRCGYLGLPVSSTERMHAELRPEFVDLMIGRIHRQIES